MISPVLTSRMAPRARLRLELFDAFGDFVAQRIGGVEIERGDDRLQICRREIEAGTLQSREALAVDVFFQPGNTDTIEIGKS